MNTRTVVPKPELCFVNPGMEGNPNWFHDLREKHCNVYSKICYRDEQILGGIDAAHERLNQGHLFVNISCRRTRSY